jgi:hypothetical protein
MVLDDTKLGVLEVVRVPGTVRVGVCNLTEDWSGRTANKGSRDDESGDYFAHCFLRLHAFCQRGSPS